MVTGPQIGDDGDGGSQQSPSDTEEDQQRDDVASEDGSIDPGETRRRRRQPDDSRSQDGPDGDQLDETPSSPTPSGPPDRSPGPSRDGPDRGGPSPNGDGPQRSRGSTPQPGDTPDPDPGRQTGPTTVGGATVATGGREPPERERPGDEIPPWRRMDGDTRPPEGERGPSPPPGDGAASAGAGAGVEMFEQYGVDTESYFGDQPTEAEIRSAYEEYVIPDLAEQSIYREGDFQVVERDGAIGLTIPAEVRRGRLRAVEGVSSSDYQVGDGQGIGISQGQFEIDADALGFVEDPGAVAVPHRGSIGVEAVEKIGEQREAAREGEPMTVDMRALGGDPANQPLTDEQVEQAEAAVAEETGLTPGEEFTVTEFGQVELTSAGRIEMAGREETGQTWVDEQIEAFERETGVDVIPGEGDVVQEAEAFLRQQAVIHQEGRGWLASPDQAAEIFGGEGFRASWARRGGQISNVYGLALGAGQLTEGVGEYGFNVGATGPNVAGGVADYERLTGQDAPEPIADYAEAERAIEQEQAAQTSTAAATAAFLASETVESIRERPFETLGSAYAEGGAAALGAFASPVRLSRVTVPLQSGDTATLRAARLQTPRAVEMAGVTPRGRTVAGLRTGGGRARTSFGAPGIDLRDVDFRELPGRGAAYEPGGILETEALYGRGLGRYARETSSGQATAQRALAVQELIDMGDRGVRGSLTDTTTEGIVAKAERVPRDRISEVARALEELDAEIFGSAAVRAQIPEARAPRDLDIVVPDEDAARARLAEALEGANADVDDVFDIKTRAEKPAPGEMLKFGRRAQPRLYTEGGVAVAPASEELIKKAGAAGFIRGRGSPAMGFAGSTDVLDVGPEPIRAALPPRYKDVADAATLARALTRRETESLSPLRRRRSRREARAVERFEEAFDVELAQPSAIAPDVPMGAGTVGLTAETRRLLRRFAADDRGQVSLAAGGRTGSRSVTDLIADVQRRIDDATRRADDASSPGARARGTTRAVGSPPPRSPGGEDVRSPTSTPGVASPEGPSGAPDSTVGGGGDPTYGVYDYPDSPGELVPPDYSSPGFGPGGPIPGIDYPPRIPTYELRSPVGGGPGDVPTSPVDVPTEPFPGTQTDPVRPDPEDPTDRRRERFRFLSRDALTDTGILSAEEAAMFFDTDYGYDLAGEP